MERRVTLFRYRKRQQRRKQRDGFLQGQSILTQCVCEFRQFRVRSLMGFKLQYPLEQISQRKQCRVLIVLRASTLPAYMWLVGNMVLQHLDQTTFAYACITRE